jgi:hypothetical protein
MLDETYCDENTKETFISQLDKKFVEQITHLTMAIQIATIIICSSDLLTQEPNSISKTNNANPSNNPNNNNSLQTQTSLSSKITRSSSDSKTMPQNESSFLFLTKKTVRFNIK